jgi:hypothetical protein
MIKEQRTCSAVRRSHDRTRSAVAFALVRRITSSGQPDQHAAPVTGRAAFPSGEMKNQYQDPSQVGCNPTANGSPPRAAVAISQAWLRRAASRLVACPSGSDGPRLDGDQAVERQVGKGHRQQRDQSILLGATSRSSMTEIPIEKKQNRKSRYTSSRWA